MSEKKQTPTTIKRRSVLKGAAAFGAIGAGPWIISPGALASSGEINVLMWSDYLPPAWLDGFTRKTGIKVNYTGIGSNERNHQQNEGHQGPRLRHHQPHQQPLVAVAATPAHPAPST